MKWLISDIDVVISYKHMQKHLNDCTQTKKAHSAYLFTFLSEHNHCFLNSAKIKMMIAYNP
jgi:hypothetical protein